MNIFGGEKMNIEKEQNKDGRSPVEAIPQYLQDYDFQNLKTYKVYDKY